MKAYKDFRRDPVLMLRDFAENVNAAHQDLLGRCAVSVDPGVRGAYERWKAISDVRTFLENRKEGPEE